MKNLRIAFLCNEYPPGPHGGIGTLIQMLARELVRRGHSVRVLGTYSPAYGGEPYEEDEGVRVWRSTASPRRIGWLADRYRLWRRVAAWCRAQELDLIEAPDWGGPVAGWPKLPVPVVVRLSGTASYFASELGRRPPRPEFWLEKAGLRRADFLCGESEYAGRRAVEVFGIPRKADAILYNPVEIPSVESKTAREPNLIVFAGTLTRKKGIVSLLKAWPQVLASRPNARLRIFGKDGLTEEGTSMQAFLAGMPSADSVEFAGHVSLEALFEVFRRARVVVLPSYAEGFSLTPLHAMAYGATTIYTSRGSGPELIEHGRNGLLVDPDRPPEIAEAILSTLGDQASSDRMGRAGRSQVQERFSLPSITARNEAFYADCLRAFQQRRTSGAGSVRTSHA